MKLFEESFKKKSILSRMIENCWMRIKFHEEKGKKK
jgi:hypothetical protein